MKNTLTTMIDLNVLLAEVEKSKRNDATIDENSVLKLTLAWELDIDRVAAGKESAPIEKPSYAAGATTPDAERDSKKSDDWRATVAQFPDD
ncbi:hypothetical protein [Rhodoglobus aureus]|uniref:Uncharacterized protein n=1 Tax=Rhodoglobus aureus TaxID=191497 RepID=A0ABN1VG46_9MICO